MFSITMHRVYTAVFAIVAVVLCYYGLTRIYTDQTVALTYSLCALGSAAMFTLMLRRWFYLDALWFRAIHLLVPDRSKKEYRKIVGKSLDNVLNKKVFRHAVHAVLNKNGVLKLFMDAGKPMVQLDIVFPDAWNNHNYLRSALGWIVTCMPSTIICVALERKDTRLVFRFAHKNTHQKDVQSLHDAMFAWKKNMQRVLVLRLEKCTVVDINYVPQNINPRTAKTSLPMIPKHQFDEHVLLTKEQVRLHIGFNGTMYYTYFNDGISNTKLGMRQYASWESLWSIWQHMSEVQAVFKNRH